MTPQIQKDYVAILKEELVPATGCTEPIAIAYAAAKLRQTLGAAPEKVLAEVSGNILKNVKSVVVQHRGPERDPGRHLCGNRRRGGGPGTPGHLLGVP